MPRRLREHSLATNYFVEDFYEGSLGALSSFGRKPGVVDFKCSNGRAHAEAIIELAAHRNLVSEHLRRLPR